MAACNVAYTKESDVENLEYQLNSVQKEEIIERLRGMGCRITKQRLLLIDVILENECSCCKEIFYAAQKHMPEIGMATIYRMINSLEDVGAIQRRNIYKVCNAEECEVEQCVIEMENEQKVELSKDALQQIIESGMRACGYRDLAKVTRIVKRNHVHIAS